MPTITESLAAKRQRQARRSAVRVASSKPPQILCRCAEPDAIRNDQWSRVVVCHRCQLVVAPQESL